MEILLVRHGETEANLRTGGKPELTRKGKSQAELLAKALANSRFDRILSSDSERALRTVKEVCKYHRKSKLQITKDLREIYRVIVGGPPKKGTRPNRFEEDLERAEKFWEKMVRWDYERVIVVCHGNIIRFFLSKAQKKPSKTYYKLRIEPTSISTITVEKKEIKQVTINDVSHISNRLRSKNTLYLDRK